MKIKDESLTQPVDVHIDNLHEKYPGIPQFVLKLMKNPEFELQFLMQNPRYITKGYVEYLPDFDDRPTITKKGTEVKNYWHGKLIWKYVGWGVGKKYSGADLRAIRKEKGVGRRIKKEPNDKNYQEAETSTVSG